MANSKLGPRYNTPEFLYGIWSHGVANGYYGGSHDYRFVFLPSGCGSFCHDGWWRYRLITFYWHVTPDQSIQLLAQQGTGSNFGPLKLSVPREPIRLTWNRKHKMNQLIIPVEDEPHDYYRVSCNLTLAAEYLTPGKWGGCCFPYNGSWDSLDEEYS